MIPVDKRLTTTTASFESSQVPSTPITHTLNCPICFPKSTERDDSDPDGARFLYGWRKGKNDPIESSQGV